jgi:hypothetical protein
MFSPLACFVPGVRLRCWSHGWCMSVEIPGGMILTRANRRTRRKTCPSATFSTKNSTWIDPGANPVLCREWSATSRLSHGTAVPPPPQISSGLLNSEERLCHWGWLRHCSKRRTSKLVTCMLTDLERLKNFKRDHFLIQVLLETLFSFTKLLNMAVVRNIEGMLKQSLSQSL